MKPGYGTEHPQLVALLRGLRPAAVDRIVWPGDVVVDVAAYVTPAPVPPELVTSVRCVVRVGDRVVVCRSPDMHHIWPGGRRLPGETYAQTARREVHEETGWRIDESGLRLLGFLHYRYVRDQPADHPYPHPDFLQVVYTAEAHSQDGRAGLDGRAWADLAGWEEGHDLRSPDRLGTLGLSPVQYAFLAALPPR